MHRVERMSKSSSSLRLIGKDLESAAALCALACEHAFIFGQAGSLRA